VGVDVVVSWGCLLFPKVDAQLISGLFILLQNNFVETEGVMVGSI
jgi:hypothetical protein